MKKSSLSENHNHKSNHNHKPSRRGMRILSPRIIIGGSLTSRMCILILSMLTICQLFVPIHSFGQNQEQQGLQRINAKPKHSNTKMDHDLFILQQHQNHLRHKLEYEHQHNVDKEDDNGDIQNQIKSNMEQQPQLQQQPRYLRNKRPLTTLFDESFITSYSFDEWETVFLAMVICPLIVGFTIGLIFSLIFGGLRDLEIERKKELRRQRGKGRNKEESKTNRNESFSGKSRGRSKSRVGVISRSEETDDDVDDRHDIETSRSSGKSRGRSRAPQTDRNESFSGKSRGRSKSRVGMTRRSEETDDDVDDRHDIETSRSSGKSRGRSRVPRSKSRSRSPRAAQRRKSRGRSKMKAPKEIILSHKGYSNSESLL
jgi:hypothetical protein